MSKAGRPDRRGENQHFVPQFYLRQWCGPDGKMWIYPVDGRPAFRAGPKNFAVEKGLYDTSDVHDLLPDTERDDEGLLSGVEGIFHDGWSHIFHSIANPEAKRNIACFLALMHVRHPLRQDDVREVNASLRAMVASLPPGAVAFEINGPRGERIPICADSVREFAQDSHRHVRAGFIHQFRHSVFDLAAILAQRKWGVITCAEPIFMTSDNPLVLSRGKASKNKFGFGTPGTRVSFPISPTMMLLIDDGFELDGLHYPLIEAGDINDPTVVAAGRFVFSAVELPE